jgi:hypothetical protein
MSALTDGPNQPKGAHLFSGVDLRLIPIEEAVEFFNPDVWKLPSV